MLQLMKLKGRVELARRLTKDTHSRRTVRKTHKESLVASLGDVWLMLMEFYKFRRYTPGKYMIGYLESPDSHDCKNSSYCSEMLAVTLVCLLWSSQRVMIYLSSSGLSLCLLSFTKMGAMGTFQLCHCFWPSQIFFDAVPCRTPES